MPLSIFLQWFHTGDVYQVWIFCKHKDTPTNQIDLVDRFGRTPVKMRNYVRHAMDLFAQLMCR